MAKGYKIIQEKTMIITNKKPKQKETPPKQMYFSEL